MEVLGSYEIEHGRDWEWEFRHYMGQWIIANSPNDDIVDILFPQLLVLAMQKYLDPSSWKEIDWIVLRTCITMCNKIE